MSSDKIKTDPNLNKSPKRPKIDHPRIMTPKLLNVRQLSNPIYAAQLTSYQTMYNPSLPNTPPPPYSPAGVNVQANTFQAMPPKIPVTATMTVNSWTRSYINQNDTSVIYLNVDGSWLRYSKGEGRAPPTPTSCAAERKYFSRNGDGSSITLSREGWVAYDDGAGTRRAMDSSQLKWFAYAGGQDWYAHSPASACVLTARPTVASNPRSHQRYDSGYANSIRRNADDDDEAQGDLYDHDTKYGIRRSEDA